MSLYKNGVSPENFYGPTTAKQDRIEAIIKKNINGESHKRPKFMTRLLGPSNTWEVFKKQQDAIDCCLCRRNGLMPFAFEDFNGRRMFLAAHPKVFWALNSHRFFKDCCSYEIIREYSACKLYLDIEFEFEFNKSKNGNMMLNVILDIINFNLSNFFNISCTKKDILDLDSSSKTKFSHHVIYELKNVTFQNNFTVGNFVKKICDELRTAVENNLAGDCSKLQEVAKKYSLQPKDILDLFILDRKGQTKLIIDEGVYTKNRHFRLFGSSKKTKGIPLIISDTNAYKPNEYAPLEYFLDSLVTYFSWKVERVLEFGESQIIKSCRPKIESEPLGQKSESFVQFHLDLFIESLISPKGRIRKKVFFGDTSTIVYDIQGYRFCENIKREHISNNIKYVVTLESLGYYQKCYDPDCADYRSDIKPLPGEIIFFFENDNFMTDVEEFFEAKFDESFLTMRYESSFQEDVSDRELEYVAKCAEAMLDIDW